MRIAFAASISCGILAACAVAPSQQLERGPPDVRPGEEFTIRQGSWVWLDGTNYALNFVSVSEDSRCPRGVTCVWEGNARVAFTLREAVPGKKRGTVYEVVDTELELNTSSRFEERHVFLNGFIELRALDPRPPIEDAKSYVATMSFEGVQ